MAVWPRALRPLRAAAAPESIPASPTPAPALPRIVLHGVTIHAITEQRCIDYLLNRLSAGRGGVVVTPNVDHLRRARRDLHFAAVLAEADLVVADGMPLVWASKLQGTPLPQRVAGSDLISSLSAAAAQQGRSIFLLGGDPGTAKAAADILHDRYPQLKIAGSFCPERGFEKDPGQLQHVITVLREAAPDIVYVGLGSPKQEQIIDRIRHTMPRAWWLGVGVSFSFLCGDVRRAPLWMRKYGLEWIHRLAQEPKRLFKRYVMVGMPFAAAMLVGAAATGIPNRLTGKKPVMDAEAPPEPLPAVPRPAPASVPRTEIPSVPVAARSTAQSAAPRSLARLRGLVLLGGSVRPARWRPQSIAALWISPPEIPRRLSPAGWIMRPPSQSSSASKTCPCDCSSIRTPSNPKAHRPHPHISASSATRPNIAAPAASWPRSPGNTPMTTSSSSPTPLKYCWNPSPTCSLNCTAPAATWELSPTAMAPPPASCS